MRQNEGLAIVPRITVMQMLRDGALIEIPVAKPKVPQRTVMIYRGDYASDTVMELIRLIGSLSFPGTINNWPIAEGSLVAV